jgi:hypothetical protein
MPSIKVTNQATAANALNGLLFAKLGDLPALISLYLSAVTNSDTVTFTIGDRDVLRNANPNIESSADVVDTDRDQVLFAEPAEGGKELQMSVTATTAVNFLVDIDEL